MVVSTRQQGARTAGALSVALGSDIRAPSASAARRVYMWPQLDVEASTPRYRAAVELLRALRALPCLTAPLRGLRLSPAGWGSLAAALVQGWLADRGEGGEVSVGSSMLHPVLTSTTYQLRAYEQLSDICTVGV